MYFSDGTVLRLYRQTIEDFALCTDLEISDEQMHSLCKANDEMSARMRAVRIVSASTVSEKDLAYRLIQKGEKPEEAKAAVEWMKELGLMDDRRTAEQIVQRCIHKGYGISRARQALYEKRIPKECWQEVLKDYPDMSESILIFLQDRLGRTWDERDLRRAIDALMRRGHSYSEIQHVMRQYSLSVALSAED